MLEIREKREALKSDLIRNQMGQKSAAVLLCMGGKLKLWCTSGRTPIGDITAGVLPLTADGEHLL